MKTTTQIYKRTYITLSLLFLSFIGLAQTTYSPYTSSGTWLCPKGVTSITVEAYGPGGGGGYGGTSNKNGGGSGGGGSYTKNINVAVTPGNTYTITLGTIGSGGTSGSKDGGDATATSASFDIATVSANGGKGGLAYVNGSTGGAGGIGGTWNGGSGGTGASTGSAGGGGAAGTAGNGGNGGFYSGGLKGAGGTIAGAGGAGFSSNTKIGNPGNDYGGGGSGGTKNSNGGNGAGGYLLITFVCPSETAAAGTDQSLCASSTYLAGNTPASSGLLGTWTKISGTGTIVSPNSPNTQITGLVSSESATFRWTIDNGLCGSSFDDVIITRNSGPSASTIPSPTTGATGICYGGPSPLTIISWAATPTATSYDVYFGAGSLPGSVTATVATNSYTLGTLLASTTYYWKVVAKSACGDAVGSSTWTFTTKSAPCYCTPMASGGVDNKGITKVSYSTVSNTTSDTGVYNDYSATQIGNVVQGASMPINVTIDIGKKSYNLKIWIDWNNDGDFEDTGEEVFSSVTSNTSSGTIPVSLTASVGYHTMRIGIAKYNTDSSKNEVPIPCFNGTKGAYEDYTLNVTAAPVCTLAPTVSSNPASVSKANGTSTFFTAAFANSPTSYIWEVSSDGGANYSLVTDDGVYSTATTATLNITGVTLAMNGFKYRASASNGCGTSSVTTVATLTVTGSYCTPTVLSTNTYWIASVSSVGNLNDTAYTGSPAWSTNGFGDYSATTIATQVPGGGVNFSIVLASTVPDGGTRADRQRFNCYVDWNGDGDFSDTGEQVYTTGTTGILQTTFGFEVPITQNPGNYRMRIRSSRQTSIATAGACTGTHTTGETEDYTVAVVPDCAAKIQSVTDGQVCGTNNSVTLAAVGIGGTIGFKWYTAETGGTATATTATGSWTTPLLATTTTYYVTSYNASCESRVRTPVVAKIVPTTILSFTPTTPMACGENSILTINATGDTTIVDLFTEDFEDETLGGFSVTTTTNLYDTNGDKVGDTPQPNAPWSVKTNTYQPTDTSVWIPAINSGGIGEHFAYTTSDYSYCSLETNLATGDLDTNNYLDLTLTFKHYYSDYSATLGEDEGTVQVSIDGGSNWSTTVATYDTDLGSASKFTNVSIDLSAYVGYSNFRFRYKYKSGWDDGWAIDDVRLFGTKQLNTTFTWTSATTVDAFNDLACTIPYNPAIEKTTTIYLKPDLTQLEAATFPITVTATLENGCPVSQIITVTNNTRVWRGGVLTEWGNPINWKPVGVPTSSNCVIIPENTIISGTNYNAYAKNVNVKPTGTLNLEATNNLTITDWLHVDTGGVFNIKNNASLVQINDDVNMGIVNIERISQPMNYYDYTYWNSPVTAGSNFTLGLLSPGSKLMFSWLPTVAAGPGNWKQENASSIMIPNKGYIVKAPESFSKSIAGKVPHTANFIGTPNNGTIYAPISKGTFTLTADTEDDEWNLIGNPYACGLDADAFLNLAANASAIDGTIYVWTHNSQVSTLAPDPFYGDYVLNYTSDDYAAYNIFAATAATTGGSVPTGYIASGQAFLTKASNSMPDGTTENATFTNSMRISGKNSDFFRPGNTKNKSNLEKYRIWLNLTNPAGDFNQIAVGYVEGGTLGLDRSFDGEAYGGYNLTFYSIIPEANLTIQGRPLPFDINDQVPLGYDSEVSGELSIRIDHIDDYFKTQEIFVEDKDLNIIHDLKKSPYVFNSEIGEFNNRFILRYTNNSSLGTESFDSSNTLNVVVNQKVTVTSFEKSIKNIEVFDLAGRKIDSYKKIDALEFTLNHLSKNNVGLILKITLNDDIIISRKIIF